MRAPALALLLLVATPPAVAQEVSEDWDLTVNTERQATVATLDFGDNILGLRCQAGELDLLLTGVPVSTGATRDATVSAGAISDERQIWTALPGQPVVGAPEPARLARQLRGGGILDVRLAPENAADRPRRYQLTVPVSTASIDRVLTACGERLEDPRDLIARGGFEPLSWRIRPFPPFPDSAAARGVGRGWVILSCVVSPNWGLGDCRVEAESLPGAGFGESALRGAGSARLRPPASGADVRGRLVSFTLLFVATD